MTATLAMANDMKVRENLFIVIMFVELLMLKITGQFINCLCFLLLYVHPWVDAEAVQQIGGLPS